MGMMFETDPYSLRRVRRVSKQFTTAQDGTVLWTPEAEARFVITDWELTVSGTTDGVIKIFDETDEDAHWIVYHNSKLATTGPVSLSSFYNIPFISAAKGNCVKITTSADVEVFVQLRGYDVGMDPLT